jgi:hypothetical protein
LNIPLKEQIPIQLHSISDFSIAYFQDKTIQYPSPHWYVIIPTKERDKFLVIMITSKIKERIDYYKNTKKQKARECLVKINNDEFTFLNRNSAINCNEPEYLTTDEIVHRVDGKEGFKIEKEKVPPYLKKDIVSAILRSPIAPRFMGKIAKEANPL